MSNSLSPSSASLTDPLSAETTGEFPELGDLGDEDIIADGGTQIMERSPSLALRSESPPASKPPPVPKAPSSLDALASTISARSSESKFAAPSKTAEVPPAPKTQPIHELDPDDLEEEEQRRIERTQPFDRSRIFGAPRPGDGLPAVVPPPAATAPTLPSPAPPTATRPVHAHLPSVVIADAPPPQNRPASIAPLAIDVTPPRALPDKTLELTAIRHVRGVPKTNAPLIAGVIAGGLAFCAAAAIALVSFTSSSPSETASKSSPTPIVAAKPREAQKGAVRSAVIETPETTPQKAAAPPGTTDEDGTPVYSPGALPSAPSYGGREASGSSSHASAPSFAQASPRAATSPRSSKSAAQAQPTAAPEPASPPVAAAPPLPPRPAAPPPTTGVIEVPGSLMTVMVDGDYKRVQGGRIVVTCGKHRVNAGRGTQIVDVPCGGVASVM